MDGEGDVMGRVLSLLIKASENVLRAGHVSASTKVGLLAACRACTCVAA